MIAGSTDPGVLGLSGISKTFGALRVLSNLSIDIPAGEIHGLIGPNGAGKTTVINIATGVYKPTSGTVTLGGTDVTRLPPHRRAARGLGRSFQGARLFDKLDVRTNIHIAVEQQRKHAGRSAPAAEVAEVTDRLMGQGGLAHAAREIVADLPYGVRKQVEIVRSCAFATRALLLDEPTAGLAPDEIDRILGIIRSNRTRLAILIVEHDMEVIMSMCDRITVIDAGRTLMTGTPDEVRQNPEVIAAYLGSDG